MLVVFAGGGTGGSVTPLIAIFQKLKQDHPQMAFLWIGTKRGPEHPLTAQYGIPIKTIAAGKLRRYRSIKNVLDVFLVLAGCFQSFFILYKYKPQVIISAGGFVAVPVVWMGALLKIPSIIHQQDVVPGLANKLMARFAKVISVTFEESRKQFPVEKTQLVGNPVRQDVFNGSKEAGLAFLGFSPEVPVVLIIGGGTGSTALNDLTHKSLDRLVSFCQVVHITGGRTTLEATHPRYQKFDFIGPELKDVYAAADVVVSRAGMSALSELAVLGKPTIIIPMPDSHQEDNASAFLRANAAVMIDQNTATPEVFITTIQDLLSDQAQLAYLSTNIKRLIQPDAADRFISLLKIS